MKQVFVCFDYIEICIKRCNQMAKNDYHVRNLYWKTMKNNERFWLIASLVMLALLVAAIILDGTNTLDIPSWAIVMWVPVALYAVYKLCFMLDPNEAEDEDEDEDEDEEDAEEQTK